MAANLHIKQILLARKLAPSKKLGQNFLVDKQTASRIVEKSGATPADTIIELGVGLGALTLPLAAKVKGVLGLEIDRGIMRYHQEANDLPGNVELLHQDLLKADFQELAGQGGGRLKIMANLPYSISNPLLFKLYENRDCLEWAVLMLQKEVGRRLAAPVGTKDYGILTVLLTSCATVETLMNVGPGAFHPRPKVDSVVVRITFYPPPARTETLPDFDHELLRTIVHHAFGQRRKTLRNSLSAGNIKGCDRTCVGKVLEQAGIAPATRPEKLTMEEFVRLTNAFESAVKT